MITYESLLSNFSPNPPAAHNSLAEVESRLGHSLPPEYGHFMKKHNGGEGFVGEQYLVLWQAGELLDFNAEYEVGRYAPGLFVFGSNGGGEAFAFDTRSDDMPIVMVPFVGMCLDDAKIVAPSFDSFLSALANGRQH